MFLKDIEKLIGNGITMGSTLEFVGRSLFGNKFHGVYPSDRIPELTARRPYAIINLDSSDQEGSHWVALKRVSGNRSQFMLYDSFGRKHTKILPTLKLKNVIDTDDDPEQSEKEMNCGQRSLAWLLVAEYFGDRVAYTI